MPARLPIQKLVDDFIIDDRRLAERPDLGVKVHFGRTNEAGWKEGRWKFPYGFVAHRGATTPLQLSFNDYSHASVVECQNSDALVDDQIRQLSLLTLLIAHFAAKACPEGLSKELGTALRNCRQSQWIPQAEVAGYIGIEQRTVERWESGAQLPPRLRVYAWLQALGLVCPPKTALVRVVDFSPSILRFLQEDPPRLRSLTPDQFERFVAERMDRMGYNVTLTGATNRKDGGIDLIAVPKIGGIGSIVIAGQVKHHRGDQKTGREAVDRLLAWKDSYFNIGLLVTNTSFTQDAIWTAQEQRNTRFLRLRDFTDLRRWLRNQWGSEDDWREIPDRVELAPGVVIEIPKPKLDIQF